MIIGIDLGTTNCCLATIDAAGRPVIIENSQGQRTTPSVVAYHPQQRLVGEVAKRQLVVEPQRTVASAKRLLGRNIEEVADIDYPLPLQGDQRGAVEIVLPDQVVKPVQVAAALLSELKQQAEQRLGSEISQAVITVPAYFTDPQRLATKQAGEIAGLQVLRIINEPTAAALAYGLDDQETERRVLVFDLGGGTLDVSVLEIGEGLFEVKGTGGDNHLGGDDFDHCLARWLAEDFKTQQGIDLSADPGSWQRLLQAGEQAKQDLGQKLQTEINLPFLSADAHGQPLHLQKTITRAQWEEIVSDLLQRLAGPINDALDGQQVDEVLMVGGMSRIPAIISQVEQLTAVQPRLADNPDQIVAQGAALQAALLSGASASTDIALIDVTPLNLGVETRGGVTTVMLAGNTPIPAQRQETFSTVEEGQDSVQVHVVQGQQQLAKMNKSLGRFVLNGIPSAPAGFPEIVVTFAIDANGILEVSATEQRSGQEQRIEIQGSSDLSAEEIAQLGATEKALVAEQQLGVLVAEAQQQLAASEQQPAAGPEQVAEELALSQQQLREVLNNPEITALSAALHQLQDAIGHIDQQLDQK